MSVETPEAGQFFDWTVRCVLLVLGFVYLFVWGLLFVCLLVFVLFFPERRAAFIGQI